MALTKQTVPPVLPNPPANTGGTPPYTPPANQGLDRNTEPNPAALWYLKDSNRRTEYKASNGQTYLLSEGKHPLQKQGYNYPVGNDQWQSYEEPAQVAENPEWDYKAPPAGQDGKPLGMNNEPLPEGAQGWTPFGEPDFGGGFKGWFKGALYDIYDNPEKTPIAPWLEGSKDGPLIVKDGKLDNAALYENAKLFWGNIGANLGALGAEKTIDPTTGERYASAPGPLGYLSQAIGKTIEGAGIALDVAAQTAESGLGTIAGTLQDLGEGSPLPEFTRESETMKGLGLQSEAGEWRLPNPFTKGETGWDLGWAQTLTNFTPPALAWNAMRALVSPPESWDEIKDTVADNWQASRIAYSALNDEALKGEFIARLKSGEDPRLLAMELGQPWQELAGKLVADPLNLFGGGAKKGADLLNHAEDAFKVAPEIGAVMDAVHGSENITEAIGVSKLDEMVNAAVTATTNRIDNLAKNVESFGRTATSKRHNLSQRVGLTLDNILGVSTRKNGTLDTEKVLEQFDLLARVTSGKTDEVTQALGEILGGGKAKAYDARGLLSTTAQETGLLLRRMLDDGTGNMDATKFVAELSEAKKGGTAAMVDLVNRRLTPALEDLFPTTLERVSAIERLKEVEAGAQLAQGEDLEKLQRLAALGDPGYLTPLFARVHRSSRPIYNAVNGFLSGIYMGMSPGYAFRNALNNNFQMFVDLGPGAWKKFSANAMFDEALKWGDEFASNPGVGGISSAAASEEIRALSNPITAKGYFAGLMDAFKGDKDLNGLQKVSQSMLRVGEYFEQQTAKRIIGYMVDRTMTALTPKAIPVKELVEAVGLSSEQARTFQALVLRYNGDLEAAYKGLRAVDNISLKSVLNTLSADDIQVLKDHKLWDGLVQSLEDVGSKDALFNTLDDLFAEQAKLAKGVQSEHVIAGSDEYLQGVQAADITDDAKALNGNKYQANMSAWNEYKEGASKIYRQVEQAWKDAGKPLDELDALWKEFGPWVNETKGHEVGRASQMFNLRVMQEGIYGALKKPGRIDLAKLWGQIGMEGVPPSDLTRQKFKDMVFEWYYAEQNKRWSGFRDETMLQVETLLQRLQQLEPTTNIRPAYMKKARELYREARALDDAYMAKKGEQAVMMPIQDLVQKAVADGNNSNAIRYLAQRYGIGTPNGKLSKYYDDYIAAVLKKYGGTGRAMTLNDALKPVRELPESWGKLMRSAAADMLDELKTATGPIQVTPFGDEEWDIQKLLMSDNPQFYKDLYQEGYKNRTTLMNALQRIMDGKDTATDLKYLRAMQEATFDRLQEMRGAYAELDAAILGKAPDLKNATLADAWAAFEKRVSTKGGMPQIEDLQDWLKKPSEVLNPPMGPQIASLPRTIKESLPGLQTYLDGLKTKIDEGWGIYMQGTGLTAEQEAKLSTYISTTATAKMQEARRLAGAVAQAQRKFTILDYGDKTNFDLALSMVMPYHFWYSRTYGNWMRRFMQDPKLLAHYARYRETLEQIHAGAPDWYKYQINTNELLGIDSKNPWYWNLEATLNPLNGLTGTDFNMPEKRVNWLTRTMDDVARFGPSIWTPFTMATAYSLYNSGEQEAAAYWGGRLFPQTATLKAVASLTNIRLPFSTQYNEIDPLVNMFSGGLGLDPFEQKRVGRALGTLAQGAYVNGEWVQISREQALDAAYAQQGEIYDLAVQYALDQRAVPQLQSFLMGVGFKGRTQTDIQIDQMYQDYRALWNMEANLSPDEFRQQMDQLHTSYPWMDAVLLAKKSGPERDRAIAFNVLGRIPPGQAGDISELFGISPEMMAEFYENKGNLSYMTAPDRDRFMAGIIELSAALALPENATTQEWTIVRGQYKAMQAQGEQLFGEDIWQRVGDFMALNKLNPDAAKLMIANNPTLQAALDWKEQAVMGNEMLFTYYGGMDFLRSYYEGSMYDAAKKEFGATIFEVSGMYGQLGDQEDLLLQQYYDMKDAGDPNARAFYAANLDKDSNQKDLYLAQHPELKAYWDLLETWRETIEEKLAGFEGKLREPLPHELRQDYNPQGVIAEPAAQQLGYPQEPTPTWQDYQALISQDQSNLLEDYFAGGTLSPAMKKSLTRLAEQLGIPYETLLFQMESSYFGEQLPTAP